MAHEIGPEDEGHVGHAHRRAGMPRLRLLDAVDGEEADGVDAKLFELVLRPDLRLVVALRLGDRRAGLRRSARLLVHASSDAWRPGCASGADYIQRVRRRQTKSEVRCDAMTTKEKARRTEARRSRTPRHFASRPRQSPRARLSRRLRRVFRKTLAYSTCYSRSEKQGDEILTRPIRESRNRHLVMLP